MEINVLKNMEKIYHLIFIFFLFVHFPIVDGQTMYNRSFRPKYEFGIKAGVNVANQYSPGNNGVFESKSILEFNGGGYCNYFLNKVLAIQAEISLSGKGSHWKEYNYGQDERKDIITYIDIPLLIRYQPFNFVNFHAGPQVSYMLKAMQYDYKTRSKAVVEDYYKLFDFGLVLGVEANFANRINVTVRYVRGLVPATIISPENLYQSYNNYLQFTAGYRFEKKMRLQSSSKSHIKRRK
jgi:hypothetical protein